MLEFKPELESADCPTAVEAKPAKPNATDQHVIRSDFSRRFVAMFFLAPVDGSCVFSDAGGRVAGMRPPRTDFETVYGSTFGRRSRTYR